MDLTYLVIVPAVAVCLFLLGVRRRVMLRRAKARATQLDQEIRTLKETLKQTVNETWPIEQSDQLSGAGSQSSSVQSQSIASKDQQERPVSLVYQKI